MAEFDNDHIYTLYKNKSYDGYYHLRVFERDKIFKNRYKSVFDKGNNPLDFSL